MHTQATERNGLQIHGPWDDVSVVTDVKVKIYTYCDEIEWLESYSLRTVTVP